MELLICLINWPRISNGLAIWREADFDQELVGQKVRKIGARGCRKRLPSRL
jgi:hypothetical protein